MIIKSFRLNDLKKNESNFFLLYGENEGQKEEVIDDFFLNNFQGEIVKYDENQILENKDIFLILLPVVHDFRLSCILKIQSVLYSILISILKK